MESELTEAPDGSVAFAFLSAGKGYKTSSSGIGGEAILANSATRTPWGGLGRQQQRQKQPFFSVWCFQLLSFRRLLSVLVLFVKGQEVEGGGGDAKEAAQLGHFGSFGLFLFFAHFDEEMWLRTCLRPDR